MALMEAGTEAVGVGENSCIESDVNIGVGVSDGPNNPPGAQAERAALNTSRKTIVKIRWFFFMEVLLDHGTPGSFPESFIKT